MTCDYGRWNMTLGGCERDAAVIVTHPRLGDVPLCADHADFFGRDRERHPAP